MIENENYDEQLLEDGDWEYLHDDMTPLDYWVELHGTTDGFFEHFNDLEVQQ